MRVRPLIDRSTILRKSLIDRLPTSKSFRAQLRHGQEVLTCGKSSREFPVSRNITAKMQKGICMKFRKSGKNVSIGCGIVLTRLEASATFPPRHKRICETADTEAQ
jgi:hypothetical protein